MLLLSQDREPFRLLSMQGMSDQDEADLFSFFGSVGPNGDNRREDVIRAQTLLRQTGDFDPDGIFPVPTGWPSSDLYRGIRKFQKRIGLDADGTLLPTPSGGVDQYGVGETLNALRGAVGDSLAGQKAPTPAEVDAHYGNDAKRAATGEAQPVPAQPGVTLRPMPAHKKHTFDLSANKGAWDAHQAALHKLLPDRPVLRHVLGSLYAEEGGRIPDPESGAVGGILPGTLDDMRRRGKLPDLPAHLKPGDLTFEQQAYVQNAYLEDVLHTVGGAKALEELPQDIADMLGDALYLDGRGEGTRFLQQGINDTAGPATVAEDGRMGPQTWEALRRIGEDAHARDTWLEEAARRRIRGKHRSQGEIDRISRLRPAGKRQ